jgi:hypothetical protein
MKKASLVLIEVVLSAAILSTPAKAYWTLEGFLGSAWSAPAPLSIHQWGEKRIYLIAKYHTDAIIPIQDGDAYVPNAALHGLFGLGYRF